MAQAALGPLGPLAGPTAPPRRPCSGVLEAMDGLPVTIRLDAVNRIREENTVLGLRGVRLGLVMPTWSRCR
ncbi:hypothetical protein ACWDBO_42535 [Streptomyces mirabilis]